RVQAARRNHVGRRVEADDAAIEVEAAARIVLDLVDRHRLRARGAVQVGQLEAEILDAPLLQLAHQSGNRVRFLRHASRPRRPAAVGWAKARQRRAHASSIRRLLRSPIRAGTALARPCPPYAVYPSAS